jgi:hypothetical protein
MITDYALALACEATYRGATQTWGTDVTHAYLSEVNGVSVVAFEGTRDLTEWAIDFDAVPLDTDTFFHTDLGIVHAGWWNDVNSVADEIISALQVLSAKGTLLACTGHSKGAAEALIFSAFAKTRGIKWQRVSTFGTPHPGYLNGLITKDDGCDYRNMSAPADPVPDVPFYLPRPRPLTFVTAPLPLFNVPDYHFMISHHIENYIAAIAPN